MIDDDAHLMLGAYEDGELSSREALEFERRLAEDDDLQALRTQFRQAGQAARTMLGSVPAPAGLRSRVAQRFAEDPTSPPRESRSAWRPLAAAAAAGLGIGGALGALLVYLSLSTNGAASELVLAAHLRALAAPQPFDIASSDKHVVKPWFNGRTPVAPEAPDLADQGFPLVGGRIDIVDTRPVPTLVYRKARHVISVTIVPQGAAGADGELRRQGSTLERWRSGDLTYWVVSDLNSAELRRFTALFRARAAPTS